MVLYDNLSFRSYFVTDGQNILNELPLNKLYGQAAVMYHKLDIDHKVVPKVNQNCSNTLFSPTTS